MHQPYLPLWAPGGQAKSKQEEKRSAHVTDSFRPHPALKPPLLPREKQMGWKARILAFGGAETGLLSHRQFPPLLS